MFWQRDWPRLPSAVREVSEVSEVSEREPCSPLRSHPLAVGPAALPKSSLSDRRSRKPVRRQAAGRAARRRPQPCGLGSTMQRARTRACNATGRYYNASSLYVKHDGYHSPVSFSRRTPPRQATACATASSLSSSRPFRQTGRRSARPWRRTRRRGCLSAGASTPRRANVGSCSRG
jgi:hypothetical protein